MLDQYQEENEAHSTLKKMTFVDMVEKKRYLEQKEQATQDKKLKDRIDTELSVLKLRIAANLSSKGTIPRKAHNG